ncbi:MAG: hypothetical protein ACRC78_01500 [Planktothrix sp.]
MALNSTFEQQGLRVAVKAFNLLRTTPTGKEVIMVPKPSTAVLSPNFTEKVKDSSSETGIVVEAFRYIESEKPTVTVNFPVLSTSVMEMKLGKKFARIPSKGTFLYRSPLLISQNIFPPATVGNDGYGVLVDAGLSSGTGYAAVYNGTLQDQLVQVPIATFDPLVNDTFAIGADAELRFSNNIVGRLASVRVPLILNNVFELGEDFLGQYELLMGYITIQEAEVVTFYARSSQVVLAGDIDTNADTVAVTFSIQILGCRPYDLFYTGQTIKC